MTALFLIAVVLLVLANGFFVAAEFALVRTRRGTLEEMAREGRRGAAVAVRLTDDLSQYLSACQLGITLASLGIGFLGEPAIADLLEPLFGDVFSHGLALGIAIALAYVITTSLHITAGEQIPKIYSIVRAEQVAVRIARPLFLFDKAMRPFISALNGVSNWVLRRFFRIDVDTGIDEGSTPKELRAMIAQARAGGSLDPGEAGMLSGVFHLHEQEA
ncbi:MAG TPA: CNNM domain-containing protein, partial [Solirubrobacteraceae bacterium]|nr:CNNM domain-containing protein [Solirubrobacteraceae bacterium]